MYLIPIFSRCRSNCSWVIGLVSGSATLSAEATLRMLTSPRDIYSRILWKRLSMCLEFWWDLGSLAWAIAPLLSQYKATGNAMVGTTPRSEMNFLIQTASLAASDAAIYSASVVESAVVLCLQLLQLTVPPFRVKTYPEVILLSLYLTSLGLIV